MMIKNIYKSISLFITLFLLASGARAQQFEGVITYEIPEMKQAGMGQMAYMIKDSNYRIEYGEGTQKGTMLIFPDKNEIVIIVEQMKGFMKMDSEMMQEFENEFEGENEMVKTDQVRQVAGIECQVWKTSDKTGDYELCVARDLGNFMMPNATMSGSNNLPDWARDAMKEGFMPLEIHEVKKNGSKELKMKAVDIQRKPLDASLFTIPEGYRDMSGMMKQMFKQN